MAKGVRCNERHPCSLFCNIRPHRLYARTLLLQMSVCWSHGWVVQKRLNWSRCRLGLTHMGPRNHVLDGVHIPHGNIPHFWGGHCASPFKSTCVWRNYASFACRRMRLTNEFAAARCDKTKRRCGLLPNYFGHLINIMKPVFVVACIKSVH